MSSSLEARRSSPRDFQALPRLDSASAFSAAPNPRAARRILFFGTYDARRYQSVRVLVDGFTALGHDVIECNVPLRLDTASRVKMLRQPWRLPLLVIRLLVAWTRLWFRSRQLPPADVVVVGYMGHFDIHLARVLFRRKPIVLDHLVSARETAVDRRSGSKLILRALATLDRAALAAADVVVVDTKENFARLPAEVQERTVVVPVGAPQHWFWPPRRSRSPILRVLFFGSFTPLQGTTVIGETIARLANDSIAFTLVGRGQDFEAARSAAGGSRNTTWIDWIEPEALPFLAASHDVCLGIFGTSEKACCVVPTKVFQGAAVGAAIVTSDTAPQRSALADDAIFVRPGNAAELAAALRSLARDPAKVWRFQQASYRRADRYFRPNACVAALDERLATVWSVVEPASPSRHPVAATQ